MSLRAKFAVYLVVLHAVLGAAAVALLIEEPLLLFIVEALFVVSVVAGWRLLRALFVPMDMLRTGAELLNEGDFTSRFAPVGQPELDDLVGIYNRMAERLREERLSAEEQHQLLQQIVEASPSGIVICDFDGNAERVNPAAERLLPGGLTAGMRAMSPGESRLVTMSGPRRLKIWRAEFRDRGFAKSFYLIEEMTEELRLSEKAAYEKLIRMMSHEVNNSVGAVRSLLESLLHYRRDVRESDRDDFTGAVTIASSRMDALNRFMGDLAEVVRIPPPHLAEVDMARLAADIALLVRPEAAARGIEVTAQSDGAAIVRGDRAQLEQAVLNVVRNAIDAVDGDGAVTIRTTAASLSVADTGPGIPEPARDQVFTPFFSTRREGRGLGLTIVAEILSNHRFGYTLENRAGGGAEFRITWE
jgi:signal transduction histidine kinase